MPGDRFEALSTDTIQSFVRPHTIAAMEELAIDIIDHRSKSIEEFTGQEFDYVITVCDNAKESCPVFHDKTQRVHWSFDVPAEADVGKDEKLSVFRRIRMRFGRRTFRRNSNRCGYLFQGFSFTAVP